MPLSVCDKRDIDASMPFDLPFLSHFCEIYQIKITNLFLSIFCFHFMFSLSLQTCMHAHVQIVNMDPQQQFCLKWNSYSSNLAMTFSNYFKSDLLADVTLYCGGKCGRPIPY